MSSFIKKLNINSLLDDIIEEVPIILKIENKETSHGADNYYTPILEYSISKNSFRNINHFDLLIPKPIQNKIEFCKLIKNINYRYIEKEEDKNELNNFSYLINQFKELITKEYNIPDSNNDKDIISYISLLNKIMTIFHNCDNEYEYVQSKTNLIYSNTFIFEYINSLVLLLSRTNNSTIINENKNNNYKECISKFKLCINILKEIENSLNNSNNNDDDNIKKQNKLIYIKSPTSLSNNSSFKQLSNNSSSNSNNISINNNEIFNIYFGDKIIINSLLNFFNAKIFEFVYKIASENIINPDNYKLNNEIDLTDEDNREHINSILNSIYTIHSYYKKSFKSINNENYGLYNYSKLLNHIWSIRKHYIHSQFLLNYDNDDSDNKIALKHLELIIMKHDKIIKWIENLLREVKNDSILLEYNNFYKNCRLLYDEIDKKLKSKHETTNGIELDKYILNEKLSQNERKNEFNIIINNNFLSLSKRSNTITKTFDIFNNILIKHNTTTKKSIIPINNDMKENINNTSSSSSSLNKDIKFFILQERLKWIDLFIDYVKEENKKDNQYYYKFIHNDSSDMNGINNLNTNIQNAILKERLVFSSWFISYLNSNKKEENYYFENFVIEKNNIIQYNNLYS